MKKQYVIVEHRNSQAFNNLKKRVNELELNNEHLKFRLNECEHKYGNEVMLNGELIDLLKQHNIPFRSALSHSYRKNNF